MSKIGQIIIISCIHDDFKLHCPVCGAVGWQDFKPGLWKCVSCGIEMSCHQELGKQGKYPEFPDSWSKYD